MKIQKYKAIVDDSKKEVVGYITEIREYLSNGSYGSGTDYLISVTEKSMPNGDYGTFKVTEESIKEFNECPESKTKEQNKDFGSFSCSKKMLR